MRLKVNAKVKFQLKLNIKNGGVGKSVISTNSGTELALMGQASTTFQYQ